MPRRFGREVQLKLGVAAGLLDLRVDRKGGLDVEFEVEKSLDFAANRCSVRIFNLAQRTRDLITGTVRSTIDFSDDFIFTPSGKLVTGTDLGSFSKVTTDGHQIVGVTLLAGHERNVGQLFEGTTKHVRNWHERVDWITELECGDGHEGLTKGKIAMPYAKGTPISTVVLDLISAMGGSIDPGTVTAIIGIAAGKSKHKIHDVKLGRGFSAYGPAYPLLKQILEYIDVRWTFQDGEFILIGSDTTLPEPPFVVTDQGTGLLALNPIEGDAWELVHLLDHGLKPGKAVALATSKAQGAFRVEKVRHVGASRGGEFTSTAELTKLETIPGVL